MAKFVRGLIFWPLLVLAVALAIANRSSVQFSFDPFNGENPAFAISVPLFMILMAGLLIGILLGGLSAWSDQGHWRRMAREARKRVAQLEAEQAAARKLSANDGATALVPVNGQGINATSRFAAGQHSANPWTMPYPNPIFPALDTTDLAKAQSMGRALAPYCGGLKLGLEFFSSHGPAGFKAMTGLGAPIFADLKYHDIPNTVAGGIRAIAKTGIAIVNVHASGGRAMMESARKAAEDAAGEERPKVIGVTVLTSLDDADMSATGVRSGAAEQAVRLAALARASGLDGVVCSPHDIAAIRLECGPGFMLIVPGVRPDGAALGDQKRVTTPVEAHRLGADILVIGRPITEAADPAMAARAIRDSLLGAAA